MLGRIIWILVGLALAYFIWKFGLGMLRSMTTSLPPQPPSGEMRRVNVRYRCTICGTELRLTMAPDQDPPPPRHCLEDMEPIAPIE